MLPALSTCSTQPVVVKAARCALAQVVTNPPTISFVAALTISMMLTHITRTGWVLHIKCQSNSTHAKHPLTSVHIKCQSTSTQAKHPLTSVHIKDQSIWSYHEVNMRWGVVTLVAAERGGRWGWLWGVVTLVAAERGGRWGWLWGVVTLVAAEQGGRWGWLWGGVFRRWWQPRDGWGEQSSGSAPQAQCFQSAGSCWAWWRSVCSRSGTCGCGPPPSSSSAQNAISWHAVCQLIPWSVKYFNKCIKKEKESKCISEALMSGQGHHYQQERSNLFWPTDPGHWDSQFDTYHHTTASQQMPRLKFTSRQKTLQLPSGATCCGRCGRYVHHQLHACNPHTKARLLFLFHTLLSLSNLSNVTNTVRECKLQEFDALSKHSQWKQRRERKKPTTTKPFMMPPASTVKTNKNQHGCHTLLTTSNWGGGGKD